MISNVSEFHKTFGAPILDQPRIPTKDRCKLRVNLIQEELNELKEALENDDIVEAADACADLMVVLCGTILELGLGDKFNQIYEEVHRSNMSKACLTEDESNKTICSYHEKDGTESHAKLLNGKWVVYRNSDNKILKSINYSPANISKILN